MEEQVEVLVTFKFNKIVDEDKDLGVHSKYVHYEFDHARLEDQGELTESELDQIADSLAQVDKNQIALSRMVEVFSHGIMKVNE